MTWNDEARELRHLTFTRLHSQGLLLDIATAALITNWVPQKAYTQRMKHVNTILVGCSLAAEWFASTSDWVPS